MKEPDDKAAVTVTKVKVTEMMRDGRSTEKVRASRELRLQKGQKEETADP
jgi:hypothetical protein